MLNNVSWSNQPRAKQEPPAKTELNFDTWDTRQLQRESARALSSGAIGSTSNELYKYNKAAPHNSHLWYQAIITDYVEKYGDLPSKTGPGVSVKLIMDD